MKSTDFDKIALVFDFSFLYKIKFDVELHKNIQSFYDNAQLIFTDGEIFLRSYNTIVCKIDKRGKFVRLSKEKSGVRTLGHVNRFLYFLGIPGGGLKWWDAQPCQI